MSTTKQEYRLAGLAEAWLPKPQRYRLELAAALKALKDDEELLTVFIAAPGWVADGIVLVTDQRLVVSKFSWLHLRTLVRPIEFSDIEEIEYDRLGHFDREPTIRLTVVNDRSVVFTGTETQAGRFRELADELAGHIGQG